MLIMAREGLEAIEHHSQSPSSTIRMEIVSSTPPLASISWDRYSVSSQTLDAFDLDTSQLIHSELDDDDDDSKPHSPRLLTATLEISPQCNHAAETNHSPSATITLESDLQCQISPQCNHDAEANQSPPSTITLESDLQRDHDAEVNQSSSSANSLPTKFDSWESFVMFESCMRLCIAKKASSVLAGNNNCKEADEFLEDGYALLKAAFCPHNSAPPPKKFVGMMKIQVLKLRMAPKVKPESSERMIQSKLSSRWKAHLSSLFTRSSAAKEPYVCLLRLQSSVEEDAVPVHAGSRETHTFMLDRLEDDLILQVQDSEGNCHGQAVVQVPFIIEDPDMKLRWWLIFQEPEDELVGQIKLRINYTSLDGGPKAGFAYETLLYDMVLEGVMKAQNFHERNLLLSGRWKWLLSEYASRYGVSKAYTNLRYLSRIMDVATPTADCISLVYDLLLPVMEGHKQNTLSRLEKRLLGEFEEQIERILALVFENYKSLDEQSPSGLMETFMLAPRVVAPVLMHAVELYALINDISSPKAQNKLISYFQAAAEKRCRHLLIETDEYVRRNVFMDLDAVSTACVKMKSLCLNVRNEMLIDVEIHDNHILPSFINLPNLSSAIYSADLFSRVGAFLAVCPPTAPSHHVTDFVLAAAYVVKDVAKWNTG